MPNSIEEKLKRLINPNINTENIEFRQWFLKQFVEVDSTAATTGNVCTLEEFAVYFLNTLRQYTDIHLKSTTGTDTPKCQTPVRIIKKNNNREESVTARRLILDVSQQDTSTPNENVGLKNSHLKNCSYSEFDSFAATPRLGTSTDRLNFSQHKNSTSTPVRRNVSKNSRRLSTTPGSANKSSTSSLCLGDFLIMNTSSRDRSNKKKSTPTGNHQQQQHQQQNGQKTQTEKPKKRLQPISISKNIEPSNNSSIFAGESSFSNENNILKISNTELEDKNQCAILAARKSLVLNSSEITKEIKNVSMPLMTAVADTITTSTPAKEIATSGDIPLDLEKLENNLLLKRLSEIYVFIIDLNLTTNILNELSFLLNLLNAPSTVNNVIAEACSNVDQLNLNVNDVNNDEGFECLEQLPNAVYFALLSLTHEKQSLGSLDSKSLGVVLSIERFTYLPDEVKTYLLESYQRKQQLVAEKPFCDTSLYFDTKPSNNVYFQHEQDSRDHFTSNQEFANFRAQRDLFYKCLKIWESNHLNPMWKFSIEITPKIKEIFNISENCINMAHLAKLFVSQLLLSASNASSPEEIGLDVDLQKFSKLTQRLIAPSQFSVDYQFPRTEAFFRDFILEARSLAFAEQLKIELYTELTTQNDSSLDQIDISKAENDADEQNVSLIDCSPSDNVVRPDILNSMLILAKFLGFTIALPYNLSSCNTIPAQVEKNQVRMRSLMQATFDVCVVLEQAIEHSKLLIAIPWLVQYFAMLDNVTLQLENNMKTLKLMYALYTYLGVENPKPFSTSCRFIIKLCLGWLFESKQFIAEQYYSYRAKLNGHNTQVSVNELDFIRCKLKHNMIDVCNETDNNVLNSFLESLLPIACPFLAEFRVSIMPAKYAQTKNASRTGRYRHITTRVAELPRTEETGTSDGKLDMKNTQNSLIQAFLKSQNTSTLQIIKFCTERCFKSVVKDGQLKILLPAKANADNLVNQITSFNYHIVYNSITTIYDDAYTQVKTEWNDSIPKMLSKRINNALESLLPEETSLVLKKTYFMIIEKEAKIKISQWFCANIIQENFFCSNLQDMTNKICNANKNKVQMGSTQLIITQDTPSVSNLIDQLQYWLHCTSVRVERFKDSKPLLQLLINLTKAFENELPTFLYHLLGAGIIQLLQHIISKHNDHLSEELIEAACNVWLHPNMIKALDTFSTSDICIYDALITIAFLESLGTNTIAFNQLKHLIINMIKKQVITYDYVNEQLENILKHEWQPLILNEISNLLMTIMEETNAVPPKTDEDNGN